MGEPAEVRSSRFRRERNDGQVEAAADGGGDVAGGHSLLGHRVVPDASFAVFQRQPVEMRRVEDVGRLTRDGYRPDQILRDTPELAGCLDLLAGGHFAPREPAVFQPLVDNLRQADPFLVLADFASYAACQQQVSEAWADVERWVRMSILNTARAGRFSSDRSIQEYCDGIWHLPRKPISV